MSRIPIFLPLLPRPSSHAGLRAGLGLAGALDLPGFRAVDVVGGNPVGVVGGSGGNGGAGAVLDTLGFGTLGAPGGSLFASLAALALLGEVRCNPDSVEEVDNADEASQEEEVEEDAIQGQLEQGADSGTTYIWGSKMLVSGSTTLTVPLKA